MAIPQRILTRKDEITVHFFRLLGNHIRDILDGKPDDMLNRRFIFTYIFICLDLSLNAILI